MNELGGGQPFGRNYIPYHGSFEHRGLRRRTGITVLRLAVFVALLGFVVTLVMGTSVTAKVVAALALGLLLAPTLLGWWQGALTKRQKPKRSLRA